ncbi:hypothetical protein KC19_5G150100 [Ceratodon purpureus]|uniref:Uncharacterized protein n=1 Tax=Ceratodon purpureus TaxID=3225 RepID=A0A8T0I1N5_CERPU|nr:hypothetical protein KC19_5G150100 [Ceratodon purpureus]
MTILSRSRSSSSTIHRLHRLGQHRFASDADHSLLAAVTNDGRAFQFAGLSSPHPNSGFHIPHMQKEQNDILDLIQNPRTSIDPHLNQAPRVNSQYNWSQIDTIRSTSNRRLPRHLPSKADIKLPTISTPLQ